MKKNCVVGLMSVFISFVFSSQAQLVEKITSRPLEVTYSKTTHVLFPYSIRSVDRGSRDILVQKAEGTDNLLLVKAGIRGFKETNLTVVTADGRLHSFLVSYSDHPGLLNLRLYQGAGNSVQGVTFSDGHLNEEKIQREVQLVAGKKDSNLRKKDIKSGVELNLTGLYAGKDALYFKFFLDNRTNIDFVLDQVRFALRDNRKIKKTSFQEIELKPSFRNRTDQFIRQQERIDFVFVFRHFTIPRNKHLSISVSEMGGGRNLKLKLNGKLLKRALPVENFLFAG